MTGRPRDPELGYYKPHPLDFELLRRLPREGTMLGFHNVGLTIKGMTESLNKDVPREAHLTSNNVNSRIRSMKVAGFVVETQVFGSGQNLGWQRTRKGEKFYEEQKGERLPNLKPDLRVVDGQTNDTAENLG